MVKLSASGITTFLQSPRRFYYRYLYNGVGLEALERRTENYDHDLLFGTVWASFTERFQKGMDEAENTDLAMAEWMKESERWVEPKIRGNYSDTLSNLCRRYYEKFSPEPDVKTELYLENDRFYGTLDGLIANETIDERKATQRAQSLDAQHRVKYLYSVQTKLYCILAQAKAIRIELAFKDRPNEIMRFDPVEVLTEQRNEWEKEFIEISEAINRMSEFLCHPAACSIIGKRSTSICPFNILCNRQISESEIPLFFKLRENNR